MASEVKKAISAPRAVAAALVILATTILAGQAPVAAALTSVTWTSSKPAAADVGATYTWDFTTGATGTISTITFTVPTGTGGSSLSVGTNLGIGTGTVALSGTTVTYTVTTPVSIAAGVELLIGIDGFTNTSTPGSYTSSITTGPGIDGPTASSPLVISANTSALSVTVAAVASFSDSTTAINLHPALGGLLATDSSTTLSASANASYGYQLLVSASALTGPGGATIARVTTGPTSGIAPGSFTSNTWGFAAGPAVSGGSGSVTLAAGLASSQYAGFPSSAQTLATQSSTTNGDTIPITFGVKVAGSQVAGRYSSNVVYTLVPAY